MFNGAGAEIGTVRSEVWAGSGAYSGADVLALAEHCRRKSLSILVPMGEEMSYRYQETLIAELQYALRLYRDRLPETT